MQNRMYGYNLSNKAIDEIEEIMENLLNENEYPSLSEYIDDVKDECAAEGLLPSNKEAYLDCVEMIESMAKDFWNGEYERIEGKSKTVY